MSRPQTRSPWYVRAWGWILLVLGILDLLSYAVSVATDDGMRLRAVDLVPTLVTAAGAIGLLSESRWGWSIGMLVGLLGVSVGAYIQLDGSMYGWDITMLGGFAAALLLIVSGLLLIFSLLTPRTRRWLEELPGPRGHSRSSRRAPDS